jgi:sugar lactone lactonase YvrE
MTTVAGNGQRAYSGDGGPATAASLYLPSGVALDAAGDLYIADRCNHRIRKVTAGGTITTAAGNGVQGYSGDGGPATAASLDYPWGVAVDSGGNLYIADTDNNRLRKVAPGGTITTVAGNGVAKYSGDGGPATAASLNYPRGVAVDAAGNLYIADSNNRRIRKVPPGGTISTAAGNGVGGYSGDGGPATAASLDWPYGVAVDSAGNLYIADFSNHRIRKVTPAGTITTAAGNGQSGSSGDGGPATAASLSGPWGVAVDSAGTLYIADWWNVRIRKVTPGETITTVAGSGVQGYSGDGGPATAASLGGPAGVVVDAAGNLYIADTINDRIRKVSFTGTVLPAFEPQLTRFLVPGFYILEATLAPGAVPGLWGLEVLTSRGQAAGGFNLGGALYASGARPAFGAFLLTAPQTVKATVNAQMPAGSWLTMRFLDAQRKQIGESVGGAAPLSLSYSLAPGFCIVEVYNSASVPVTYQLGLAADFFAGALYTGGYLAAGITGFGAFYVPEAQEVTMKLFGQNTYGGGGAGSMILTLKDANRQVLQVVGP